MSTIPLSFVLLPLAIAKPSMLTSVPIPDTSINGQLPRGKDNYLKGWYQYFSVKGERERV
ncbi:MAG: hypothetical protein RM347_029430 [Nostoc sp. ChiQUE02]|uniref:hypothetical protein n=1 Tax=Nostoc sp. ChiQUE02 TaxID=3075377 RepID=UPI002AD3699D|nr:hypothetical protein [Nostoc sp. ChiQUE02]MDZ8232693.1 hypothetical protein [Nostoc sp. ChiQUE02]